MNEEIPPIRIAPSLLSADFTQLNHQIQAAETAGARIFHFDVMDGQFVPNITMGPFILEAVRRCTTQFLDVHLMIENPDQYIPAFVKAGANRIHVHWETCPHLHRTLGHIRSLGCEASVAINPHTPVDLIQSVIPLLDCILIMTVNPGFGGQAFIPNMLEKIQTARGLIQASRRSIDLMVDGGITVETAPQVVRMGARTLVAGSSLFNAAPLAENYQRLLTAALNGLDEQVK